MKLDWNDPKVQIAIADALDQLREDLAEVISTDDLEVHEWLRRIVVSADDLTTRTEYRALEWAKTR